MCSGGSQRPPAELPEAPRLPDPITGVSGDADKKRKAAARGTILTGPRGTDQQGTAATKTLLGE